MAKYNRWGFENPDIDPNAGESVTLTGTLERQTENAILLKGKEFKEWLPKSLVAIVHDVKGVKVTMPLWLARKKEIGLTCNGRLKKRLG
jgi:hypothetical protein